MYVKRNNDCIRKRLKKLEAWVEGNLDLCNRGLGWDDIDRLAAHMEIDVIVRSPAGGRVFRKFQHKGADRLCVHLFLESPDHIIIQLLALKLQMWEGPDGEDVYAEMSADDLKKAEYCTMPPAVSSAPPWSRPSIE